MVTRWYREKRKSHTSRILPKKGPADSAGATRYHVFVAIRARWPSGRLKHFKVWPPGHNVEVVCCICGRRVRRMKSDIRPGQRSYDTPACRVLGLSLFGMRAE